MLGAYLGIPKSKVEEIKVKHPSQGVDKCKEVLRSWLQSNPNASWKEIIEALTLMEENTLAAILEDRYLQPAFIYKGIQCCRLCKGYVVISI